MKPYTGLFVLDASQGIAGPYCATLLAACGADVVKLEPPAGDWSRGLSTREGSQSVMHVSFNRGKRSVMLDLQTEAGRAAMQKLAAKADVMLEAFRPGVAKRIGLVPEAGKRDVVFLSISGFGQQGPNSERPCTDGVAQAYTGLVSLNIGADGIPHRTGQLMAVDMTTGLSACIAVQAALAEQARDRHAGAPPQRRVLDVSLMQSAAALMGFNVAEAGLLGRVPPLSNVPAGTYQGSDGRWFMVAFLREPEWVLFCQVMERPEIAEDPRFQGFPSRAEHRDILLPMLREIFAQCTAAEWSERFKAARMLCDLVNSPLDWLADPHVQAVGAAVPLAQPGLGTLPFPQLPGLGPWSVPAPALGEHTEDVLREIGL
ncbi:CoA transferase [Siccirubricoccus deserti]|uniref:CoA transferase n=1 Tax=Siccirubricoccus deserti TaxID=2013562 RepID=A0A9X0QVN4_9PROT|nr:CoA transferase [Siccirubricoccus deserti]MBC4014735.1 CoA transferase [Siccirubricoccus deserti]GGC34561.1 CoA transferase [Siccirubricoccus deserti]